MVSIKVDNPKIENEIRNLLDVLVNAGSGFHSKLLIHEQNGGLGIKTAEPMEYGREIIRLPRTVLMPNDQYTLDVQGNDFVVYYPPESIATDLQRRVIDKMYEIYNLTNKAKLHQEFSFLFSLLEVPDLIEKLGEGREFILGAVKDWVEWIKNGLMETQRRKILIETFVKTRPLGYSDPLRESSVSMIMPVLDFMNHHWEGGNFGVSAGAGNRRGDLAMNCSQPLKESLECYANYGTMDAFDTLVRYDFVDETAPIVRSVPVDLEGPAGDIIHIRHKLSYSHAKELAEPMKDLRRHIPDIKFVDGRMTVSHILIPADQSKFAMARVLNLILGSYNAHHSKGMTPEQARVWNARSQQAIVDKNKAYYKDLLSYVDDLPTEKREGLGVARVRNMALHQLKKISRYKVRE